MPHTALKIEEVCDEARTRQRQLQNEPKQFIIGKRRHADAKKDAMPESLLTLKGDGSSSNTENFWP